MRMWAVPPIILCRQHLLGAHNETHMFAGTIIKKKALDGYIKSNALEISSLIEYHETLAVEMARRKYNHNKPLPEFDVKYLPAYVIDFKIDKRTSLWELVTRCKICYVRYQMYMHEDPDLYIIK